ncbi:PaaI family thioesterase [Alcanivorax limicola]|uniref:PaaI family thioesterase n=1 Tax=Alcanivorax limicola TaxID=2874102 RepID=UPI001CBD9A69|nr:PaaI family thioesterase [Alcanivorax limicola]
MDSQYGFFDTPVGEPPPPTPESLARRDIAAALRQINERLVRLDTDEASLRDYAARFRALADELTALPRRPQEPIFRRLLARQGSRQDVLDIMDHEIMTGQATALSPPLELWRDGDVVRGRATLGAPWQGPPGRVHGGVIALMMDILLAKTQDMVEGVGMTGTLNLRYQAGTPLKQQIDMEGRITRLDGRKLMAEGRFIVDGQTTVTAEGIWICANGSYARKALPDAGQPAEATGV